MSVRALTIVQSLVTAVADRITADLHPWNGKSIVLPYPVPEHNGEEDCCKGLILGVIERVYLTDRFPVEVTAQDPCGVATQAADLSISVLRCGPRGDNTGYVTPTRLGESALAVWQEAEAAWVAVQCYLNAVVEEDDFFEWGFRGQAARPNDEGCVGTDLSITIGYQNRCGPC